MNSGSDACVEDAGGAQVTLRRVIERSRTTSRVLHASASLLPETVSAKLRTLHTLIPHSAAAST